MSNAELVIRALSPVITIFSVPFSRFGILPVGGRSTAIKLQSGDVFVLASSPLCTDTKETLKNMGEVKYLLTPDYVHAAYISQYHQAYPDAKCIGPKDIDTKKPDVKWTGVMGAGGEDVTYGFEDEIKLHYFPGHKNREIAVLHMPSRTLIQADLLFNLPPKEQYSKSSSSSTPAWPLSMLLGGMQPGGGLHDKMVAAVGVDKEAMIRDCKVVNGWNFDRIIPCHGEVIETGGKQAFQTVFKRFL